MNIRVVVDSETDFIELHYLFPFSSSLRSFAAIIAECDGIGLAGPLVGLVPIFSILPSFMINCGQSTFVRVFADP
jgi:hypothetical protein